MKVLIVGTDKSCLEGAPFDDPSYQVWTMAHRLNHFPRVDVGFEVHGVDAIKAVGADYYNWLCAPNIPIWVHPRIWDEFPKARRLPVENMKDLMEGEYFASTFSYMLAKAILDEVEEIAIHGINLTADDEYQYQRPNAEYLIGLARGKGIKVTINERSALLKAPFIYGDGAMLKDPLLQEYEDRLTSISEEIDRVDGVLSELNGAKHEIVEIIKKLKDRERGAG